MLKKQVLISVTGASRYVGEDDDVVQLLTTGTLSGEKNRWQLEYTETQPDNDKAVHQITLILQPDMVTMLRAGTFSTSMVFQQGHRFEGTYNTPYGKLTMGIFATQVFYQVDEESTGVIQLQYQLDIQGQPEAMHDLRVRFCPARDA